MHKSSLLRMEWFVNNYILTNLVNYTDKIKVLDVGSFDVNGTYKCYFDNEIFEYNGLDMCVGKNVDIVPKNIYNWEEVENNSFDIVISGQCFEHVEFPWILFYEMCKIMKPNGLMCVITPRLQGRHRYPVDTFRYDVDGYIALCKFYNIMPLHVSFNEAPIVATKEWFSNFGDCMLIAQKPKQWDGPIDIAKYTYKPTPIDVLKTNFLPSSTHPAILADKISQIAK